MHTQAAHIAYAGEYPPPGVTVRLATETWRAMREKKTREKGLVESMLLRDVQDTFPICG